MSRGSKEAPQPLSEPFKDAQQQVHTLYARGITGDNYLDYRRYIVQMYENLSSGLEPNNKIPLAIRQLQLAENADIAAMAASSLGQEEDVTFFTNIAVTSFNAGSEVLSPLPQTPTIVAPQLPPPGQMRGAKS